jgi:hypothetical protein
MLLSGNGQKLAEYTKKEKAGEIFLRLFLFYSTTKT